jgi:hypothetical protein
VGTYPSSCSGAVDPNYTISYAPGTVTVNPAGSTIVVTGSGSFVYNTMPQGPDTSTVTGSTGAVTYSYSGTGTTIYPASATKPTNVGTYQVVASVAADSNNNGATSAAFLFTITSAYESDVTPRPTGKNSIDVGDYTQTGLFAAGLQTPDPVHNEFQRADSAPRATKGDGSINVGDYVQAGRYAANLDAWMTVGGPTVGSLFEFEESVRKQQAQEQSLLPRILRAVDVSTSAGQQVTVSINVDANGDENGFGFTISYDGTKLSNPVVTTGADMPFSGPIVNTLTAGKVGVVTAMPTGSTILPGTREVVKIRFNVSPTALPGQTPIVFTGFPPVVNKVVDALAGDLPTTFTTGIVTILSPTAANTSVGGMVLSADGRPVRGARLSLTDPSGLSRPAISNSFGFFRFDDVAVGETYVISVRAKGYTFAPRVLSITDEVTNLNLVAEP